MDNIGALFGGKYKTRSHSNREDGKLTCLDRQSKGNPHGYHEVADTSTDPIVTSLTKYPLHVTLATLVSRIFQTFRASVDYESGGSPEKDRSRRGAAVFQFAPDINHEYLSERSLQVQDEDVILDNEESHRQVTISAFQI
ncbi:hypothetical protein ARMGADRAFT_1030843 [Armillaria gallica]|uniref:Uncharacterized protein n=1 Tax=Armillaria gallica TaxID=47427 RepID=A0A2H3DFK2_ARMGA|nr:hypothetical protein ARMGADRAFT_1030843 [Armillaria gallica]